MLGLYWHDDPPSRNTFYDYRVVAHYGAMSYPGRRVRFSALAVGTRLGTRVVHHGLTITSPNPIEVVATTWAGSTQTGLHVGRDIVAGPVVISLPETPDGSGPRSITLHLAAEGIVTAAGYVGTTLVGTQITPAGEVTISFEEPGGISQVLLLPGGPIDLISLVIRNEIGVVGDLVYDVFHVRPNSAWPTSRPTLEPPKVVAAPTGLSAGQLVTSQSRVDLRWDREEAGSDFLRADAPIFYQVQRTDLADDGSTVRRQSILNLDAPTLVSERPRRGAGSAMYSDGGVPDGKYAYAVRGWTCPWRLPESTRRSS